jgi:septum formation protein
MLVLASASPRRRELLAQAGFSFQVQPSAIPELQRPDESPIAFALRLAREKAESVFQSLQPENQRDTHLVLGADTVVIAPDGSTLGKPADARDAARMLRLLSGATHQVVTGLCLRTPQRIDVASELTYVTMRTLSDQEITAYIATGEPTDKAGAYAIQGYAARWIPRVHGCYFNVVGLPIALATAMLEAATLHESSRALDALPS